MDKITGRIQTILGEIPKLADDLICSEPLFDAYLYRAKIRCGKHSCRCMKSDVPHDIWCISYTEGGESRTRTVPLKALAVIRRMTSRWRQLRRARSGLIKLTKEVLNLVDSKAEGGVVGWEKDYSGGYGQEGEVTKKIIASMCLRGDHTDNLNSRRKEKWETKKTSMAASLMSLQRIASRSLGFGPWMT